MSRPHGNSGLSCPSVYFTSNRMLITFQDIRDFKENRETYHQMFPYEKADRFNRGIRKLGLSQDGSSYLDQFRILISQIGKRLA